MKVYAPNFCQSYVEDQDGNRFTCSEQDKTIIVAGRASGDALGGSNAGTFGSSTSGDTSTGGTRMDPSCQPEIQSCFPEQSHNCNPSFASCPCENIDRVVSRWINVNAFNSLLLEYSNTLIAFHTPSISFLKVRKYPSRDGQFDKDILLKFPAPDQRTNQLKLLVRVENQATATNVAGTLMNSLGPIPFPLKEYSGTLTYVNTNGVNECTIK